MKKLRKILTVALAAAMVTGAAVLPASATVYTDQELAIAIKKINSKCRMP